MTSVSPKKGEHPLLHLALQNMGMLLGAGIMTVIALYEQQLQSAFSDNDADHHDHWSHHAWVTERLIGWVTDWLLDWLIDWLTDWLND